MRDTKKLIADIIQEGLLNGKLKSFNEFLMEKSLNDDLLIKADVTETERERILNKLEEVRQKRIALKNKLRNVGNISYLGDLIISSVELNKYDLKEIIILTGLKEESLNLLIKNQVNVTSMNTKSLSKLFKFFKISLEDSVKVLKNTFNLYSIEPVYKNVMARYKPGEPGVFKDKSMKDAFNELILKANDKKSLIINNEKEKDKNLFNEFIKQFCEDFNSE